MLAENYAAGESFTKLPSATRFGLAIRTMHMCKTVFPLIQLKPECLQNGPQSQLEPISEEKEKTPTQKMRHARKRNTAYQRFIREQHERAAGIAGNRV